MFAKPIKNFLYAASAATALAVATPALATESAPAKPPVGLTITKNPAPVKITPSGTKIRITTPTRRVVVDMTAAGAKFEPTP